MHPCCNMLSFGGMLVIDCGPSGKLRERLPLSANNRPSGNGFPCLQLTDQVAKVLLPESKNVEDFSEKVIELEKQLNDSLRLEELHSAVCKEIASLVDITVPEFLYRAVGENEYQAELLTSQANVRSIKYQTRLSRRKCHG